MCRFVLTSNLTLFSKENISVTLPANIKKYFIKQKMYVFGRLSKVI